MTKRLQATLAAILVLSTMPALTQTSSTTTPTKKTTTTRKAAAKKAPAESATDRQIRELREQMVNQQAQIDELRRQNAAKDAKLATASQDAQAANATAAAATAQAQTISTSVQENKDAVTQLNSTVTDLKTTNVGLAQTISDTKKDITAAIESPLALRYKRVTLPPIGFFALETVYRSRAMASDVNTPFNSTPYQGAGMAHVSELN